MPSRRRLCGGCGRFHCCIDPTVATAHLRHEKKREIGKEGEGEKSGQISAYRYGSTNLGAKPPPSRSTYTQYVYKGQPIRDSYYALATFLAKSIVIVSSRFATRKNVFIFSQPLFRRVNAEIGMPADAANVKSPVH